ncbi:ComF family protein [Alloalcanivorax xenomutans]|uniref:ComF family protein n=1 Tax=Alloalcanivorax xenomutans TaxID=1094342 RepID=UPI00047AF519
MKHFQSLHLIKKHTFSICLLCGRRARAPLCPPCQDFLNQRCRLPASLCRCGLPDPAGGCAALCGRCLKQPPPFTTTHCDWRYDFPLDRLITAYKHHGQLYQERAFAHLLAQRPLPWAQADALCPISAHWRRRLWRGFDQAERLAHLLAPLWRRPVLPALRRQRATAHQQGSSRRQRLRNLHGAFTIQTPVRGLRLLLVDDVMTSGGSAREAAATLLAAGATEVRVWVLSRTC